MSRTRPPLRVGLTGGIASGKSTVAGFLGELGAMVLDGDRIAHEVMAPDGPAYEAVVARFGREILDRCARIDRAALARIVFADPAARAELNRLVHPAVRDEVARRLADYDGRGHAPVAVFEAALLVETGAYREYHKLVVVKCSREAQIRRLVARGLAADDAIARIDAQAPLSDKLAVADYVIDTETTIRMTRLQTEQVYAGLIRDFEDLGSG